MRGVGPEPMKVLERVESLEEEENDLATTDLCCICLLERNTSISHEAKEGEGRVRMMEGWATRDEGKREHGKRGMRDRMMMGKEDEG